MNNHFKFAIYVNIAQTILAIPLGIFTALLVSIALSFFNNPYDIEAKSQDIGAIFTIAFWGVIFGASYATFWFFYKKLKKKYHLDFNKSVRFTIIMYAVIAAIFSIPDVDGIENIGSTVITILVALAGFYLGGKSAEEGKSP